MISGSKTGSPERRGLRWLLALLLAATAWPALALDLPSLMNLLGQRRSGEALFHEQRFVQGIDTPLVSTGSLAFEAPDRFVRRTLKPRPETIEVDGNKVTLSRAGRSRSFNLDAAPEMIAVVESVRATLSGDGTTLRRHFDAETSGTAERWTLLLTPLETRLGAQVKAIRISGRRGDLASIEMELPGGDRSLMTIEPLRAAAASAGVSKP